MAPELTMWHAAFKLFVNVFVWIGFGSVKHVDHVPLHFVVEISNDEQMLEHRYGLSGIENFMPKGFRLCPDN
eukprot:9608249-Karenia_brevis.AAC.1